MTFDLRKTLDLIGHQTAIHLQDRIKRGSFASGALHDSIRWEVTEQAEGANLSVFANDTIFYVFSGRRAGAKMPPKEPIATWMAQVGIDPKLNWVIRRSIAKKGIPAKNYLRDWIAAKEPSWQKLLGDAAVIDLTARFTERFKDLTPKAA